VIRKIFAAPGDHTSNNSAALCPVAAQCTTLPREPLGAADLTDLLLLKARPKQSIAQAVLFLVEFIRKLRQGYSVRLNYSLH
jgi:hypothetical protein